MDVKLSSALTHHRTPKIRFLIQAVKALYLTLVSLVSRRRSGQNSASATLGGSFVGPFYQHELTGFMHQIQSCVLPTGVSAAAG